MNVEVKGQVHDVLTKEVGQKNTTIKTVVIDLKSDYNPYLPIDFIGKSLEAAEGVKKGDQVAVSVNLGGREWQGKYFPNIGGWKLEITSSSQSSSPQPVEANGLPKGTGFEQTPDEEDDLPF